MTSKDGLMTTTAPENYHHIASYNQICDEYDKANREWIKKLIAEGYKAAHPNDGWVNREEMKFSLTYPHFDLGVKVGDKVMLGWHTDRGRDRPVVVTSITKSMLGNTWYEFKDIGGVNNE